MNYIVGVDIGGTFTDVVVVDAKGKVTLGKTFSQPSNFSEGVIKGIGIAARQLGISPADLLGNTGLFLHSTTIAENAIVGGALDKGGLLVTRGFEDTLFIMRGGYGRWSGLSDDEKKDPINQDKPPPVIPLQMIRGIKERTDSGGQIIARVDENEVIKAVENLLKTGAEAIGVSFLWSFRNPENENIVKRVINQLHPGLFLTISSEIAPTLGEYERTSTVALNACLGPLVSNYLGNLKKKLEENGFRGTMLVMQAYGGLLTAEEAASRCVGMIESGPVSGLVGSKLLGDRLGFKDIIATDMGGTTFKVGVVKEGTIEYQREPTVFRYHYALPKMDIVSIGIAGGSVISLDPRTNAPRIGPRSAGAYPGPVCYGFGGKEPTLTDVDLILGYLNPGFFLGGSKELDIEKASHIFKSTIADPLGMDIMKAAGAIYRLANSLIYDLVHKMTVARGVDPRGYLLFAFGGTAGMHAAAFARELDVRGVVIPHSASVHGAFGLVSADLVYEEQITRPLREPVNPQEINDIFSRLAGKVTRKLRQDGYKGKVNLQKSIDMRFRRQVHLVTTPVNVKGPLNRAQLEKTCNLFVELYKKRYGQDSAFREAGIELVSFKARGTRQLKKPQVRGQKLAGPVAKAAFLGTKKAYFDDGGKVIAARTYDFEKLLPGNVVEGAAIIWTPITTIVINPGQKAHCDQYKNILITWKSS